VALQLHINVSLNRPPDRTWRRPPGRPRNKWLDQLQNDSTRPIGDLWSRAVDRGHGGAVTQLPIARYATMMMMMITKKWCELKYYWCDFCTVSGCEEMVRRHSLL